MEYPILIKVTNADTGVRNYAININKIQIIYSLEMYIIATSCSEQKEADMRNHDIHSVIMIEGGFPVTTSETIDQLDVIINKAINGDRGNYPVYKRTESGEDELVSTEYTYQAAKNKVYELNGWEKEK